MVIGAGGDDTLVLGGADDGEAQVSRVELNALVARLDESNEIIVIVQLQGMMQDALQNGPIGGQDAGMTGESVGLAMDDIHENTIAIRERPTAWKFPSRCSMTLITCRAWPRPRRGTCRSLRSWRFSRVRC